MSEHLGYDKHAVEGRNRENSRNGKRSKTIVTEAAGEVQIDVPRDRDGSFTPQVVKKRQRRLSDLDAVVISLYSKGLTTAVDLGALRRGLRRLPVQGHRLADHRPGHRGHAGLDQQATAECLRGGVHRRDPSMATSRSATARSATS